jgi:hypothetical protein
LGWIAAPESDDLAELWLSFSFPSIEHRSHHLHVVEETISDWRGWLAFRDHLRAHSEVAKEYALLKERLADAHGGAPNDRQPYRAGKRSFIGEITEMALAEAEHGPRQSGQRQTRQQGRPAFLEEEPAAPSRELDALRFGFARGL